MLKVNMVAGPLQLSMPSSAAAPVSTEAVSAAPVSTAADPPTESNLFQGQPSNQVTTVEEVNAEMVLILHPRAGILLHSKSYFNSTEVLV